MFKIELNGKEKGFNISEKRVKSMTNKELNIIRSAVDELEFHCGSSDCQCWADDAKAIIKELEQIKGEYRK